VLRLLAAVVLLGAALLLPHNTPGRPWAQCRSTTVDPVIVGCNNTMMFAPRSLAGGHCTPHPVINQELWGGLAIVCALPTISLSRTIAVHFSGASTRAVYSRVPPQGALDLDSRT
jgi:hypothetical protein